MSARQPRTTQQLVPNLLRICGVNGTFNLQLSQVSPDSFSFGKIRVILRISDHLGDYDRKGDRAGTLNFPFSMLARRPKRLEPLEGAATAFGVPLGSPELPPPQSRVLARASA